ncbi:magnesium transporter CorA family protein [Aquabacter cavernae]|uniref:magnesium transporter CorA family protein n=1 Tax=Aquabacter cavernae TaxID=2496029 RepID=UPI000F8F0C26|nr:magnesium transporter CorA family protein [Aquabacter cavernae]
MLIAYEMSGGRLARREIAPGEAAPESALWLDLVCPSAEDERLAEEAVGIGIPTREDLRKIEPSSRLYVEDGARFMTLSVLVGGNGEGASLAPVSFILAKGRLVTVRYDDAAAFGPVAARLQKSCPEAIAGDTVLVDLVEAVIDRTADMLEEAGQDIERLSKRIFERDRTRRDYRAILTHVGRKEGLMSSAREALNSLSRMIAFLGLSDETQVVIRKNLRTDIKSMARDVQGLSDYANFLANKLQFMLDGTVGLVSLEQNNIIKIFAVLSVVFMPPTLIASIYGMNFEHIPELRFVAGYPVALIAMALSAVAPYLFFKWRGWL